MFSAMFKSIAVTTAISVFAVQPLAAAADVATAELIHEEHFSEQGVEVDLYVTRDAEGPLLSEATLHDPESPGTEVDLWTDGVTVWWHGTIDGDSVSGSTPTADFGDPQEAAFCFTPVTAIICLGALAVMASGGCYGKGFCVPDDSEVPGGAGGVPDEGGGGDGGGDDDGSGSGGGDED